MLRAFRLLLMVALARVLIFGRPLRIASALECFATAALALHGAVVPTKSRIAIGRSPE